MPAPRSRRASKPKPLPPPTPSEAAFERLVATFGEDAGEARIFVDELFAKAPQLLVREPYANIGDAAQFNTKVVGVTFEGRQDIAAGLEAGAALELRRDGANLYDPNAIAVYSGALQIGYLKRDLA